MDAERIRFWAYEALSGYETQSHEEATDGAILNLLDILSHVADDPTAVSLIERTKATVRLKRIVCDRNASDLAYG